MIRQQLILTFHYSAVCGKLVQHLIDRILFPAEARAHTQSEY